MKSKNLLIAFTSIIFFGIVKPASAQVNKMDSMALVDLYNATNGPSWKFNTNWLTKNSVATWAGITVIDNRVTGVSLVANNLKGKLPASIGNLSSVTYLLLDQNKLKGNIPATVGKLSSLVTIYLSENNLSGCLPDEIGNLKNLNTLALYTNQLSGNIPASVGNMTSLTILSLYNNQFSGRIPASINKLTHLEALVLANNKLSGQVPNVFTSTALNYVDISSNQLTNNYNFKANKVSYTGTLLIYFNAFTFDGIEALATLPLQYFVYDSQAQLAIHKYKSTLSVNAGGTLANNTYTWYQVDTNNVTVIKGDSTFKPSVSGKYYAVITNSKATDLKLYTDTVRYRAENANQPITKLSVYPNPVNDVFRLTGLQDKGRSIITISDVSGHILMQFQSINQSMASYNISNLKPGNYLLHAGNGNNISEATIIKK